jgi:hypothetical protein
MRRLLLLIPLVPLITFTPVVADDTTTTVVYTTFTSSGSSCAHLENALATALGYDKCGYYISQTPGDTYEAAASTFAYPYPSSLGTGEGFDLNDIALSESSFDVDAASALTLSTTFATPRARSIQVTVSWANGPFPPRFSPTDTVPPDAIATASDVASVAAQGSPVCQDGSHVSGVGQSQDYGSSGGTFTYSVTIRCDRGTVPAGRWTAGVYLSQHAFVIPAEEVGLFTEGVVRSVTVTTTT